MKRSLASQQVPVISNRLCQVTFRQTGTRLRLTTHPWIQSTLRQVVQARLMKQVTQLPLSHSLQQMSLHLLQGTQVFLQQLRQVPRLFQQQT
jgi:hypothetical protein